MALTELRILPPLTIARLGASRTPLEAYDLQVKADDPLGFRAIVPQPTLVVDPGTGAIARSYVPEQITFKDGDDIRPVAPFLEVWARVDGGDLEPLTLDLLAAAGFCAEDVHWSVHLANHKIFRRTGDPKDRIDARVDVVGHGAHALYGECPHFREGKRLPLGSVRYIRPTREFPEIRFRFTPAAGLVYGAQLKRATGPNTSEDDPIIDSEDKVLYDPTKGKWVGLTETDPSPRYTNPAQIYAGYADAKKGQVSWGYLDDECDGIVRVTLGGDERALRSFARIGAGPPAFAPDTLPIRTVMDELEMALHGPERADEVPVEEAEEIVRRAFETVRMMNTAVMNGNAVDGRLNVASTMVRQDSNDFKREYTPIAAPVMVDTRTILQLHERVFTALRSGSAPWFGELLRQPEQIGDLTDRGRRRMPALMRGADGRMLALTRRQIATIQKAAKGAIFRRPPGTDRGEEQA